MKENKIIKFGLFMFILLATIPPILVLLPFSFIVNDFFIGVYFILSLPLAISFPNHFNCNPLCGPSDLIGDGILYILWLVLCLIPAAPLFLAGMVMKKTKSIDINLLQ